MRLDWDQYFMRLAETVAERATCDRKHVGAVIVRDRHILSTGYNGAPAGLPHCTDVGHQMDAGNHCIRTVHAEANAIAQAAMHGVSLKGAAIYITASPCDHCIKLLLNTGIKDVWYKELYRNSSAEELLASVGGTFRQVG